MSVQMEEKTKEKRAEKREVRQERGIDCQQKHAS